MAAKQRITELNAVQLVEYLERTYPARCIGELQSETHAHRYAGKCELIETLKQRILREEQDGITT
jgi:hypothetical protein